ncbi:MAG TPA: hypothetical protein PKH80_00425 [Methanofastidiosum sp.]|nr:hypothetical protein [Methanofastidiosum sp.]HNU61354.1 hypothetical protein [Methanofastidiosum sp.]
MQEIIKAIELLNETQNKVELCFTKKYRNDGKTIYSFYRGQITDEVSNVFKDWLIYNLNNVNSLDNEIEPFSLEIDSEVSSVTLDAIDNWHHFDDKAFNLGGQETTDLEKIKHDLNNFILYLKTDTYLIGQIRILHPKDILSGGPKIKVFITDDNVFNKLEKERKGIEIDDYCDFIFIIGNPTRLGLVVNRNNFISIFDLNEQSENEAINIVSSSEFYNSFQDGQSILNIITHDRRFQKMINNPVSKLGFAEMTLEDLVSIKEDWEDLLKFNINEAGKIDFENGKEKEGFKDLICCMGHRYTISLRKNHLLEGIPKKIKQ